MPSSILRSLRERKFISRSEMTTAMPCRHSRSAYCPRIAPSILSHCTSRSWPPFMRSANVTRHVNFGCTHVAESLAIGMNGCLRLDARQLLQQLVRFALADLRRRRVPANTSWLVVRRAQHQRTPTARRGRAGSRGSRSRPFPAAWAAAAACVLVTARGPGCRRNRRSHLPDCRLPLRLSSCFTRSITAPIRFCLAGSLKPQSQSRS